MENFLAKMKIAEESQIPFVEFGTRRRRSADWQETLIVEMMKIRDHNNRKINFLGTSNVHLAIKHHLPCKGTQAHEFFQACQVLSPTLADSQKFALTIWIKEYGTKLGIALSDIFGVDAFMKDFGIELSNLYDGTRHDSGNEIEYGEKMIDHYLNLGIDPKTKSIVFSDGLDFERAAKLYNMYKGRINVLFGIGTNITNDCGYDPLQIVMKMDTCNGNPTIKLSDSPGKMMCKDDRFIKRVQKMINKKLGT